MDGLWVYINISSLYAEMMMMTEIISFFLLAFVRSAPHHLVMIEIDNH